MALVFCACDQPTLFGLALFAALFGLALFAALFGLALFAALFGLALFAALFGFALFAALFAASLGASIGVTFASTVSTLISGCSERACLNCSFCSSVISNLSGIFFSSYSIFAL